MPRWCSCARRRTRPAVTSHWTTSSAWPLRCADRRWSWWTRRMWNTRSAVGDDVAGRARQPGGVAHAVEGACAGRGPHWNPDRRTGADCRAAPLPGAVPGADPVRRTGRAGTATRRAGAHRRARGDGDRRARAPACPRPARRAPVYASAGNYLLARFADAQAAFDTLLGAGVVVRDQRAAPQLGDALRISIGSPEENDRVLAALSARRAAA